MKTPTFAPDLKIGQKVRLWDSEGVQEIADINSTRTRVILKGFLGEFKPVDLVILRGELKEFSK